MQIKLFIFLFNLFVFSTIGIGFSETENKEQPLSAIDWLTDLYLRIEEEPNLLNPSIEVNSAFSTAQPTNLNATTGSISVAKKKPLDLSKIFIKKSSFENLSKMISQIDNDIPPPLLSLFYKILSTHYTEAFEEDSDHQLLKAQIDKLLNFGAVNKAKFILDHEKINSNYFFDRWFSINLITYTEQELCKSSISKQYHLSKYKEKIFCLAILKNIKTAKLTLTGLEALEVISLRDEVLLYNLLHPDMDLLSNYENLESNITPLDYRIYKHIGKKLSLKKLPKMYHYSTLLGEPIWEVKISATEGLVKTGAVKFEKLISAYLEVPAEATGELSKRARLTINLEKNLKLQPTANTTTEFTKLFRELQKVGLESAAIRHYSNDLLNLVNSEKNSNKVLKFLLKSADLNTLRKLKNIKKLTPIYRALIFDTPLKRKPNSKIAHALLNASQQKLVPIVFEELVAEGKYGDAILSSILLLSGENLKDPKNLEEGIGLLNFMGLNELARETSIYLLANKVVK